MKKIIKYIKKYPFDFAVWLMIVIGLLIAAYFVLIIFVIDDNSSKYGERLENIESYPVNNGFIVTKIKANADVNKVKVEVMGKVLNIEVLTDKPLNKKIVDEIAVFTTKAIEKDYREFYDVQLFIAEVNYVSQGTKPVIGYMRAGNSDYAWTYNKGALS